MIGTASDSKGTEVVYGQAQILSHVRKVHIILQPSAIRWCDLGTCAVALVTGEHCHVISKVLGQCLRGITSRFSALTPMATTMTSTTTTTMTSPSTSDELVLPTGDETQVELQSEQPHVPEEDPAHLASPSPDLPAKVKAPRVKKSKADKQAVPKLTKPPKVVEKPLYEKLGTQLADGLVRDPRQLSKSLNLVDRVSYVKLPQAAAAVEEEDDDEDSLDSSLMDDLQATGETVKKEEKSKSSKKSKILETFTLHDFTALACLEALISQYGRVSHMGILDPSYTFFLTKDRRAALYYKIKNKTAVIGGDPLCPPSLFPFVLTEFEKFRKKHGLGLVFLAAGESFVNYAHSQKYTTMCFAYERVINPMTNPVVHSNAGKSIIRTTRNLLDSGLTVEVYNPSLGKNPALQQQLIDVYEAWRTARNSSGRPQAYITIFDPFALPELMTYIYTKSAEGVPNGFAALRILGAEHGYHLDPYVAAPGSPPGITDLLIYCTMSLLNTAKISYLSLGYEPLDNLGEIRGIPKALQGISRKVHKRIFDGLHVAGKKDYHDKFHPDRATAQSVPGISSRYPWVETHECRRACGEYQLPEDDVQDPQRWRRDGRHNGERAVECR